MHYISYDIVIEYEDLFSNRNKTRYTFFAKNEEDAKKIAYECFLMEVGSSSTVKIKITPTPLSDIEKDYIKEVISNYLSPIRDSLHCKVYKDFIKSYENLRGYDLKLSPEYNSFWFEMNSIICKVVYESGLCYIDTEEIVISDKTSNRKYIVRCNLQDYYIGV